MLTGDFTCDGSETPVFLPDFLSTVGHGNRLDWNWPEADLVIGFCQRSTASSHHNNTAACVFISEAQPAIDRIKSFQVQPFPEHCKSCALTVFW